MLLNDPNFKNLDETDKYIIGHVFENAYLIDKITGEKIYLGNLYGDPSCGIIDKGNKWCLVGGETLVIWKTDGTISPIKDEVLYWTCRVRQIDSYNVELLVDAWSDRSSIWKLNIDTFDRHKVKDIITNGRYEENLDW